MSAAGFPSAADFATVRQAHSSPSVVLAAPGIYSFILGCVRSLWGDKGGGVEKKYRIYGACCLADSLAAYETKVIMAT